MYNHLVSKVNAVDTKIPSTSESVTETQYDSDKYGIEKTIEVVEKNIPYTSGLFKKTRAKKIQRSKARYLILLD